MNATKPQVHSNTPIYAYYLMLLISLKKYC